MVTSDERNIIVNSDGGTSKIDFGFYLNNVITAKLSTNQKTTTIEAEILTLDTEVVSLGDKLSLKNGKITIGIGVSIVRISGQVSWESNGNGETYEEYIYKNDSAQIRSSMTSNNTYYNNVLASKIISVNKGDTIALYARSRNSSGAVVSSSTDQTWLTVEVLE